jgi:hypothetical protein
MIGSQGPQDIVTKKKRQTLLEITQQAAAVAFLSGLRPFALLV